MKEQPQYFARVSKVNVNSYTPAGHIYDQETTGFHIGRLHRAGCSYLKQRSDQHGDSEVISVNDDLARMLPRCGKCLPEPDRPKGPTVTITFAMGPMSDPPRPAAPRDQAPEQAKQIGARFLLGPANNAGG